MRGGIHLSPRSSTQFNFFSGLFLHFVIPLACIFQMWLQSMIWGPFVNSLGIVFEFLFKFTGKSEFGSTQVFHNYYS